jgi:hypothetical protein
VAYFKPFYANLAGNPASLGPRGFYPKSSEPKEVKKIFDLNDHEALASPQDMKQRNVAL